MSTGDFTIAAVREGQPDSEQLIRRLSSDQSEVQQSAVKELSRLISSTPDVAHHIDAKTATVPLCSQLSAPETDVKLAAASTLSALARASNDNHLVMAQAGVLSVLRSQLTASAPEVKAAALIVLGNLAENQQITQFLGSNFVQELQHFLQSQQHSIQLAALNAITAMARCDIQTRRIIGTIDMLVTIAQLLNAPSTNLQHAAAIALADIALTSRDQVNLNMIHSGALPALVAKLDLAQLPPDQSICHQACRALCNLSGDNDECDDAITRLAAIPKLVHVFHHGVGKVSAVAAKTLGNLALYSVENQRIIAECNTIEICLWYLEKTNPRAATVILEATCRLLHCLLMDDVSTYTKVVDSGGLQRLIYMLSQGSTGSLRQAAAGALSHVVCTKRMPLWQRCNEVLDSYSARQAFNSELDNLHARHQTLGQSDMVTDQMTEVQLADKSRALSAGPTDSDDEGASDEDIAKVQGSLQQMQM